MTVTLKMLLPHLKLKQTQRRAKILTHQPGRPRILTHQPARPRNEVRIVDCSLLSVCPKSLVGKMIWCGNHLSRTFSLFKRMMYLLCFCILCIFYNSQCVLCNFSVKCIDCQCNITLILLLCYFVTIILSNSSCFD